MIRIATVAGFFVLAFVVSGEEPISICATIPEKWRTSFNISASIADGELTLRANDAAHAWTAHEFAVPYAARGRDVALELDVENVSSLELPLKCRIEQLDRNGRTLPEDVVDTRFISWQLPPGRMVRLRERGFLRHDAVQVKVAFELRAYQAKWDNRGFPVRGAADELRAVRVSALSLKAGSPIPPPVGAASRFEPGVKGQALRLDGESAFWFATRSQASWGRGLKDAQLDARFFPSAGVIEAWFRPDEDSPSGLVRLLEASSHSWRIMFNPPDKRDSGTRLSADRELTSGKWHHVFVPFTNVADVSEVYVGAGHVGARVEPDSERRRNGRRFFKGLVDDLRITGADGRTYAHFTFDGNLYGTADVGCRRIPGTFRFPPSGERAAPFDTLNFRELPSEDDLRRGWKKWAHSADVTLLDGFASLTFDAPDGIVMDSVEIANTGADDLVCPVVLNEGEVDTRSWADVADSLGVGPGSGLSDREKADRLFAWLIRKTDYFMNHPVAFEPDSDVPFSIEYRTLRQFNSYGLFECVPLNQLASRAFLHAGGMPVHLSGGYGHGFEGVWFGGRERLYDLSARKFFPDSAGEPMSLAELEDAPGALFAFGNSAEYYVRYDRRIHWFETPQHHERFGQTLRPGERIVFMRGNDGTMNDLSANPYFDSYFTRHKGDIMQRTDMTDACGARPKKGRVWRVDRFFPDYANAFLLYDGPLTDKVWRVRTSHPVVAARYRAERADGTVVPLALSTDGGITWRDLPKGADGSVALTYPVRGRTGYRIRIGAEEGETVRFFARTELETNRRLLTGELHPGANRLVAKADGGTALRVKFAGRVPTAPFDVPGVENSGFLRGFEKHVAVRDAPGPNVRLETVRGPDGGEKTITVVEGPGVKMLHGTRILRKAGETARYECDIEPGRYAFFVLDRFASHSPSPTRPRVELLGVPALQAVNDACMLHKSEYGTRGGRAAWKWDYPTFGHYPYMDVRTFDLPVTRELVFRMREADPEGPVEIGAVIVVPEPERDFVATLVRSLCGINFMPSCGWKWKGSK